MSRLARCGSARRGISLLEVLITIFIVSVGLLSVFTLFIAGREREARAAVLERANSFANVQATTLVNSWLRAREWQRWDRGGEPGETGQFRWVFDPAATTASGVQYPLVIDPWTLASDTWLPNAPAPADLWNWDFFFPLFDAPPQLPFQRITLPRVERAFGDNAASNGPLSRDEALSVFADRDSVEYDVDDVDPEGSQPKNAFTLGRRRLGTDLTAALYLDRKSGFSPDVTIGEEVTASLLVFHKPVPDYEDEKTPSGDFLWPAGFMRWDVKDNQISQNLIEITGSKQPKDDTVIRRSMRPGRWILVVRQHDIDPDPTVVDLRYESCWAELVSATLNDEKTDGLLIVEGDLPPNVLPDPKPAGDTWFVLSSEHLVLVRPLSAGTPLLN